MRLLGGHNNDFARIDRVLCSIDGDSSIPVQAKNHRIAIGDIGADFFAFVEHEQGQVVMAALCP